VTCDRTRRHRPGLATARARSRSPSAEMRAFRCALAPSNPLIKRTGQSTGTGVWRGFRRDWMWAPARRCPYTLGSRWGQRRRGDLCVPKHHLRPAVGAARADTCRESVHDSPSKSGLIGCGCHSVRHSVELCPRRLGQRVELGPWRAIVPQQPWQSVGCCLRLAAPRPHRHRNPRRCHRPQSRRPTRRHWERLTAEPTPAGSARPAVT
jgi:hypothetical protein